MTPAPPPSDEGGGFLRSKKTEGENNKSSAFVVFSPSVIFYKMTAPSSEGAKYVKLQYFIVLQIRPNRQAQFSR